MDPLTLRWCTFCMCGMFSHGGYLPLERKITRTYSNFSNRIYKGIEFFVIDVCHWHHTALNCFIATTSFILEARAVHCLEGSSLSAVMTGIHLSCFSLILLLASSVLMWFCLFSEYPCSSHQHFHRLQLHHLQPPFSQAKQEKFLSFFFIQLSLHSLVTHSNSSPDLFQSKGRAAQMVQTHSGQDLAMNLTISALEIGECSLLHACSTASITLGSQVHQEVSSGKEAQSSAHRTAGSGGSSFLQC